jgi:hypothetical protein
MIMLRTARGAFRAVRPRRRFRVHAGGLAQDRGLPAASVGRKSGAHSAAPKARAYSRRADYRRNRVPGGTFFFTVNLHDPRSDLLVTQIDILRDAVRRLRVRTPFRIDRLGCPPRSYALPLDLATRRCRLPRSVARNQNRICEVFAYRLATITGDDQRRRAGHLAALVLGAHDTRRSGLCGSHGRHAFQPGETRFRGASGGLAAFVVSSVRGWRTASRRVAGRQ